MKKRNRRIHPHPQEALSYYLQGWSYQQIADKFSVALSTVRGWSQIHGWAQKAQDFEKKRQAAVVKRLTDLSAEVSETYEKGAMIIAVTTGEVLARIRIAIKGQDVLTEEGKVNPIMRGLIALLVQASAAMVNGTVVQKNVLPEVNEEQGKAIMEKLDRIDSALGEFEKLPERKV